MSLPKLAEIVGPFRICGAMGLFLSPTVSFLLLKTQKQKSTHVSLVALVPLVVVAVLPFAASAYLETTRIVDWNPAIYRARAIVVAPPGIIRPLSQSNLILFALSCGANRADSKKRPPKRRKIPQFCLIGLPRMR
jgi:tellurite resistance protein TehA-like permease